MKRSRYEQFAIVHADSASLFQKQLNEEICGLKDNDPVVKFSESIPFYAQIKYYVDSTTPEKISEEYELQGVQFLCAQCPYFKPVLTDDGEVDRRYKYGDCEFTDLGRTFKKTPACDKLYELIAEGSVKLCFME